MGWLRGCEPKEQGEGFLILLSSYLSTGPAATQAAPLGNLDLEMGSEAGLCVAQGPGASEPGNPRAAAKWPDAGPACARPHPVTELTPRRQGSLACRLIEEPQAFCPNWQDHGLSPLPGQGAGPAGEGVVGP